MFIEAVFTYNDVALFDFNSDGIINVLDVIQVVNIILGNTSPGYGEEELDKNDAKAVIYFNAANTDLFVTTGTFTIDEVLASSDGTNYVNVEMNMPVAYAISDAYPNPFNPSTAIDIALDTDANVSVKVFNIMGQLVDVVSEGNLNAGSHSVTWDASQVSSGVYFINTEIGSDLSVQKVMLVK